MRSQPFFLLFLLLATACRTDEPVAPQGATATLRIQVQPEWQGQPLQLFSTYEAPFGYRFQVEFLKLYLSDLRLVTPSGETLVDQVRLLNLGNGPFAMELEVPAGSWLGMRAGLGLPHDLNYSNPALYGDAHPLSVNTGMYWTWASGYKFVLFDGRGDADPNGTGPLLVPFSVHTGMDTCYTTVDLFPSLPFSTEKGGVTSLTLHVDVHGFLQTAQDTIDVITENQAHGNDVPLALKLTRNVVRSMQLEQQ